MVAIGSLAVSILALRKSNNAQKQAAGVPMPRLPYLLAAASLLLATPAIAAVPPFPPSFTTQEIAADGATIHVRVGGKGPAVVLLHGYGETGDMWAPLAAELMRDHRVIVPDLRGLGLS
jgi:hypothetical protein